ncbi:MAG: ACP S-malonyltransferase [Anaerolineae bacterium]|jgi:[acyl-carrier-protein] S-malonyltransferase|nr:ACP S-malonyltransferase [Anaerolineae bacterium]MDH7473624.1 ACP S-malonyltransferase [Anaerolineae bacterium]
MDQTRTAFVFPGGGVQYVGMGRDLCETYPQARAVFAEADDTLGFPLSRLCFEGPEDELLDIANSLPAIMTVSIAILRVLEANGLGSDSAGWVAGHSAGEITALVAAGMLDFVDGLRLMRTRSTLMREAGERRPGGMAAVIGVGDKDLEEICVKAQQETGEVVLISNYNAPGQLVLSGHEQALERALALAQEQGARRAVRLAVTIASHCALMESAAAGLRQWMENITFHPARIPLIANVTATPLRTPEEIRHELGIQLVSPVRWTESIEYLIRQGVDTFIEVGPKDVLNGLIKRTDRNVRRISVGDVASLESLLDDLNSPRGFEPMNG